MSRASVYIFAIFSRVFFLISLVAAYTYFSLPNVSSLKNVHYQQPLEILSQDGELIESFGRVFRIPVKIDTVPTGLKNAILVTEDQRFYEHIGIDLIGLGRALRSLVATGEKRQGASTITMQVARNFFLGREKTYFRKLNEVLLALAIERSISKEEILELYLNKIYLGHRSYGFAAASKNYFNKTLGELTLAEMAMLAGLPKSPSRNNPIDNASYAVNRRNLILGKMLDKGLITEQAHREAIQEPLNLRSENQMSSLKNAGRYIADLARQTVVNVYGEQAYEAGIKVYTTVNSKRQIAAAEALISGLETYDKKEGWHQQRRQNLWNLYQSNPTQWRRQLQQEAPSPSMLAATVVDMHEQALLVDTDDASTCAYVDLTDACWLDKAWCQPNQDGDGKALSVEFLKLQRGDTVYLESQSAQLYKLTQMPTAQGSLVALNAKTSEVEALIGGYSFRKSHFNRAVQAYRQPGSAIKPLIYAAALENGFTMASKVNDAPVVIEDIHGENDLWRPRNVDHVFVGPIRLRQALIQSRNLVSIRLANEVGLEKISGYLSGFGLNSNKQPKALSVSLGSGLVTPLQLAHAFTVFTNQGTLEPVQWIKKVVDKEERPIWDNEQIRAAEQAMLPQETKPEHDVISPETAYMITNGLRDVIRFGTGRAANVLNRDDLSGKTGTSNDQKDAWFSGYNADIVATVWVGHDESHDRHLKGMGSRVALPVWIEFMRKALSKDSRNVEMPDGIVRLRINRDTGLPVVGAVKNSMFELFARDKQPENPQTVQPVEEETTLRDEIF